MAIHDNLFCANGTAQAARVSAFLKAHIDDGITFGTFNILVPSVIDFIFIRVLLLRHKARLLLINWARTDRLCFVLLVFFADFV
jgi:hypothetical protein